ncbi:MAG: hypothetical protein GXP24_11180 [Planctomycetes bacterium]|nr:hypothetical protein [Planctomycetota bacterium]
MASLALAILILTFGSTRHVAAQYGTPAGAQPSAEQIKKMKEMRAKVRGRGGPSKQPGAKKAEEKKPEKKDGKKDGDKKKDEGVKTIKRPTDDSGKLDPDRMRLTPDKNGMVQFNYNGHPWAEVLQEFADAAKFSFDWQELPADKLNLVTQKKYNLLQARGLLNRHLLARGFTLIVQGEMLTAVKIDKLDPSLVPRVEADELEDFPPYDFVRVRFKLPPSMDPAKAKDDVKVLLSPNAKVTPLLNTKRLLVIDSVINLRSVRDLIYAEQSAADAIITPEVYYIKHRRAAYVAEQVMIVLGLDPSSRKKPQELQLETQRMQLYMQMQQKGKDVSKFLKKSELPVHIAVDQQQNTIMINAPAKLLPLIDRTIKTCDVPIGTSLTSELGGRSTKPHKTTTASTDAVVSALTEFGQLDPLTRLQSDSKTKTIFAYATEADHEKIKEMIAKLDSSGRDFHVIQLRRLRATGLAGTLMTMIVGKEKKKENNSRRRFSYFGMSNNDDKKEEVGFKAMPDVESNRLILWANADELVKVRKMLVQLGESPDRESRDMSKVRVLRSRSPEETAQLLERLKAAYPGKLNIDDSANQPKLKPKLKPKPADKAEDKVTQRSPLGSGRLLTVQTKTPAGAPDAQAADAPPVPMNDAPSVNVVVTDDGRIVISSDDLAALNELEDLLHTLVPSKQEFKHFKLKHVTASRVVLKLEEYFKDELKDQTESVFDMWGDKSGSKDKDLGRATLGRRELMRFMSEDYTNTVIVQGASPSQLAAVEQLLELYDQAPVPEEYLSRKTEVIQLKYSRAQDIATSLKEVYRELLSSKDKEFQDKEGKQSVSNSTEKKPVYVFGEVTKDASGEMDPVLIRFDGMLAIGVDAISNSLIISARKEILESVIETVELLDKAATPKTMVHVYRVGGALSAAGMQKTLKTSLSQPWPGGKPHQPRAKSGGGQKGDGNGKNNDSRRKGR